MFLQNIQPKPIRIILPHVRKTKALSALILAFSQNGSGFAFTLGEAKVLTQMRF
jgi:hypothetical protein